MRSAGLLLLLAAPLLACGSSGDPAPADPGPPPDELAYELFESTIRLTEADLAQITTADADGTIAFASQPLALADVDVGAVLLGGISAKTPNGLLRVVTAVDRTGGLVLRTASAPLELAFRKLHVKLERKAEPFDDTGSFALTESSPLALRPQFTIASGKADRKQRYEIVVFDGDGDVETKNDQIRLDATLGGGFTYALSVDVDWGDIDRLPAVVVECVASLAKIVTGDKPTCRLQDLVPEARSTFRADPFMTLDVKALGAASLAYERDFDVGAIALPPFALGPLVFTPSVDVLARVQGGASARFEVGANVRADAEVSIVVSSKTAGKPVVTGPRLKELDARATEPVLDLHATAEASVGARLNASLYGVAGPYATVHGVARIEASPLADPCWTLGFSLEAELGARITSPKLPALGYVTLADASTGRLPIVDREVARGTCTLPDDPPGPPGSGPTARAFAAPAFTPWAKRLQGGALDGLPVTGLGVSKWTAPELARTVDGRWLATGTYARGLHKIDDDGLLTWISEPVTTSERSLAALATAPTGDAGMLALLAPESTETFVLAKTTQAGTLLWSRAYRLGTTCTSVPSQIVKDGDRGYLVLGRCREDTLGWIVRVDERGDVTRARTITEPGSRLVLPVAATIADGEPVLVGEVARPGELEWTFVMRLDGEDRPSTSMALSCPELIATQPTSVIPSASGGVTVLGTANGVGLVARVRRDGALGFARYPNVGAGVTSYFVVASAAELPTTGLVIGATMGRTSSETPNALVLAGLDSAGSLAWAKSYAVTSPTPKPIHAPAIRLTDDGGVFATAISATVEGADPELYAMKVFAKDGSLGDGQALSPSTAIIADEPRATVTRAFAPVAADVAVTVTPLALRRR